MNPLFLLQENMQLDKQSDFNSSAGASSAAASSAAEETCLVPVGHFFYVNHIFNKELKRIEEKNGINIKAEVNVTFEAARGDGSPQNALSEFITLVQKCLGDSHSSVIPLKHLGAEELKDTLKIIKTPENKLLLALSSQEMIVYGPKRSQDAISESLKATMKSPTGSHSFNEFNESPDIGMSIKDPLTAAGLTINEDHWRLMTTSFSEHVSKIKAKFGVRFQESAIGPSTVRVKAVHKRSGGNAAMESHAARALLHLYQEIVTSPMNLSARGDASASPNSWEDLYTAEGISSGPVLNGKSGHSSLKATASVEQGATAGDSPEETCPICMDTFTNKKQLKCKHEFCEECLAKSKKSMGSICPVCKDVFGVVTGDQPEGTMTSFLQNYSLPGFPKCNTIVITYDIPSGIQKVNVFKYLGRLKYV